jgi:23S rRNA (uridine2552-2'-O)-methyltransferase
VSYDRKDAHYHRARAAGYRARSAYKLAELNRRYRLLRHGDAVVDLGCWPGGWLQVVGEVIGPEGHAVGVDVAPVAPLGAANLVVVQGDVYESTTIATVLQHLGRPADVVLSDLSPKLTGVRATDQARSTNLAHTTLGVLTALLRPGGRLLMKVFMNPDQEGIVADVRARFASVHVTRPEASRHGSAELYLIALGFGGSTS